MDVIQKVRRCMPALFSAAIVVSALSGCGGGGGGDSGGGGGGGAPAPTPTPAPAWVQEAYIKASNTAANSRFAQATALSADGKTLVVGAPGESSNAKGVNGIDKPGAPESSASGAVYVFNKAASGWVQQAYIKAPNADPNDRFGNVVAISGDGNMFAVSAIGEGSKATGINGDMGDNSVAHAGAVYVYARSGGDWVQQAYVKPSKNWESNQFGIAMALSGDGRTLAVGARSKDTPGGDRGVVYVFARGTTAWAQQAILEASNPDNQDLFGMSGMSISDDGNTLALGATGEDSNAKGVNGNKSNNSATDSGAVYVFVRNAIHWSEQAYLKASNTDINDAFGFRTKLSADGNTLAISAISESSNAKGVNGDQLNNSSGSSGAVYVWVRAGNAWSQQAYLKASNTDAGDFFGYGLALSADGNSVAVGAMQESSKATGVGGDQADNSAKSSGAVYVFARSGATWAQKQYIKASNAQAGGQFGVSVSLNADGAALVVGTYAESSKAVGLNGDQADNTAKMSGAAYAFTLK